MVHDIKIMELERNFKFLNGLNLDNSGMVHTIIFWNGQECNFFGMVQNINILV